MARNITQFLEIRPGRAASAIFVRLVDDAQPRGVTRLDVLVGVEQCLLDEQLVAGFRPSENSLSVLLENLSEHQYR